jgi:HEAT repeat protein
MRRFFSTIALCVSLLAGMSYWIYRAEAAKEDAIITLLNLPAPPPPNPLVTVRVGTRPPEFYDREQPPPDNAPIEDLMEYWSRMSSGYQDLSYNPKPSATVASRIFRELAADPGRIVDFMNVFQDDRRAAEIARAQYQKLEAAGDDDESGDQDRLKAWLRMNTSEFSGELESVAGRIRDVNEYVNNHEELLALSRVDWDRAEPIVKNLYNDKTQKVSQVLATWAMYKRALESGGSDVDKYRDELKAVVENKEATAGMRDLALDALVKEPEWPGRDDWYVGLLEDETLAELRVRGSVYTGLTTIMYHVGDDRLTERMVGLMSSENIHVRTAAAKNLLVRLGRLPEGSRGDGLRKQIVESMLPWLSNKSWIRADSSQRSQLVTALQRVKIPEAVPALIDALDEKESMSYPGYAANTAANAVNPAANAANTISRTNANTAAEIRELAALEAELALPNRMVVASNQANATNAVYIGREYFPLRSAAIAALGHQGDARAASDLRRVLLQSEEWERTAVVKALLDCGGFTTTEQVAALEFMARSAGDVAELTPEGDDWAYNSGSAKARARFAARSAIAEQRTIVLPQTESDEDSVEGEFENYAPPVPIVPEEPPHPERYSVEAEVNKSLTEDDLKYLVAAQLVAIDDPDEMLVRSTVDRVTALDPREPTVAATLRKIILGWNGVAVNSLILRDIKNGRMDADAILKMLAIRKKLRETQMSDVTDLRTGVPAANAIAACLLEDRGQYEAIATNGPDAAKIALFACGRLIRAQIPVDKAAASLASPNKTLATAAERYLEAEDSPEARAVILRRYPNQARILGATTAFNVEGVNSMPGIFLRDVFNTVNPYFGAEEYAYLTFMDERDPAIEKRLRAEVSSNPDLLGVYAYDRQFVRIYKDKAVFSWEDDPARYRERTLEPQHFESLKTYFASSRVDAMPPFLACSSECNSKQLLMIGKAGGRRVFVKGDRKMPEFFENLQGFFDEMKKHPTKLKYYAAERVPGTEVLFEDERYAAASVWKKGADLRVLLTDEPREKAIEREVDRQNEREVSELNASGEDSSETYSKYYKIKEASRFEATGWFGLAEGKVGTPVNQPAEAEYIPSKDSLVPAPTFGSWAAKTPTFEIRADESGLYKVSNGRSVKLRSGHYSSPVVTTNGRWAIATKYDPNEGSSKIVRVNLVNNRELKVGGDDLPLSMALAYLPTRNLVFLSSYDEGEDHHHGEYDENYHASAYDTGRGYYLMNPDTGAVVPAVGEVRPIAHQTFRSLQPTSTPGDYWAAIPRGKAGTLFGIYSTRTFSFKPILKLPKLLFDSMEMWVDEAERKVYFIHQGHLLAAPYPVAR